MGPTLRRLLLAMFVFNTILTALLFLLKKIVPSLGDEASDAVGIVTILGESKLASHSDAFLGGTALTMAGQSVIDLRRATLRPEGARLHLNTVLGGTVLLVPEDWRVELDGRALLGSIYDTTANDPATLPSNAPTLHVEAMSALGEFKIVRKARPAVDELESGTADLLSGGQPIS